MHRLASCAFVERTSRKSHASCGLRCTDSFGVLNLGLDHSLWMCLRWLFDSGRTSFVARLR
eukprot:5386341-Prymnesium_polylepis.1